MVTALPGLTPVCPFVGDVAVITGGESSRVVYAHEYAAAIAFPARSFAPVVIVAVMLVGFGSVLVGLNLATCVVAVYVTVPEITAPVLVTFRLKVVVLIVAGSIGSLNVTVAVADDDT